MDDKTLVKRNGTEFYRKKREVVYEKRITLRYSTDKIEKLKQIASKNNTKYQTLIKNTLDDLIKKESE